MASRNMGLTGKFGSLFNGVVKEVEWVGVLGKVEVFEKEELVKAGMSLMSTCIPVGQKVIKLNQLECLPGNEHIIYADPLTRPVELMRHSASNVNRA